MTPTISYIPFKLCNAKKTTFQVKNYTTLPNNLGPLGGNNSKWFNHFIFLFRICWISPTDGVNSKDKKKFTLHFYLLLTWVVHIRNIWEGEKMFLKEKVITKELWNSTELSKI